jgi:hypothetical protein
MCDNERMSCVSMAMVPTGILPSCMCMRACAARLPESLTLSLPLLCVSLSLSLSLVVCVCVCVSVTVSMSRSVSFSHERRISLCRDPLSVCTPASSFRVITPLSFRSRPPPLPARRSLWRSAKGTSFCRADWGCDSPVCSEIEWSNASSWDRARPRTSPALFPFEFLAPPTAVHPASPGPAPGCKVMSSHENRPSRGGGSPAERDECPSSLPDTGERGRPAAASRDQRFTLCCRTRRLR